MSDQRATATPRDPIEEREAARDVRRPDRIPPDNFGPATGQRIPDPAAMGEVDDRQARDQIPPAVEPPEIAP